MEQGTTAQYARVTTFQLQPQTTDGFLHVVRTTVLPVARARQQGTKGILVLTIEKGARAEGGDTMESENMEQMPLPHIPQSVQSKAQGTR
jgi:hypothetical protein